MLLDKKFWILASGTNIGKTHLAEQILLHLAKQNRQAVAIKPLMTGGAGAHSDEARLRVAGKIPTQQKIVAVNLALPASPDIAASAENCGVDFESLLTFINLHKSRTEYLLIEGIGGIMTPVNNRYTMLDLVTRSRLPAILVVGSYLGAISHALTAYETMCLRGIEPSVIVVNSISSNDFPSEQIANSIANFVKCPIFTMNKLSDWIEELL